MPGVGLPRIPPRFRWSRGVCGGVSAADGAASLIRLQRQASEIALQSATSRHPCHPSSQVGARRLSALKSRVHIVSWFDSMVQTRCRSRVHRTRRRQDRLHRRVLDARLRTSTTSRSNTAGGSGTSIPLMCTFAPTSTNNSAPHYVEASWSSETASIGCQRILCNPGERTSERRPIPAARCPRTAGSKLAFRRTLASCSWTLSSTATMRSRSRCGKELASRWLLTVTV